MLQHRRSAHIYVVVGDGGMICCKVRAHFTSWVTNALKCMHSMLPQNRVSTLIDSTFRAAKNVPFAKHLRGYFSFIHARIVCCRVVVMYIISTAEFPTHTLPSPTVLVCIQTWKNRFFFFLETTKAWVSRWMWNKHRRTSAMWMDIYVVVCRDFS